MSMDVHRLYRVYVKVGASPEVQGTIDEAGVQTARTNLAAKLSRSARAKSVQLCSLDLIMDVE